MSEIADLEVSEVPTPRASMASRASQRSKVSIIPHWPSESNEVFFILLALSYLKQSHLPHTPSVDENLPDRSKRGKKD